MKLFLLTTMTAAIALTVSTKGNTSDCKTSNCSIPASTQEAIAPAPTVNNAAQLTAPISTENVSSQNNELNQDQSGVLQNTQVNVNNIGSYSFAPGISCATPGVALSAFGNSYDGNAGIGGTVSYVVPLGGRIGSNCKALTTEILRQRQLDTSFTLVAKCSEFIKSGIAIDYKRFPELAICQGITVKTPVVNVTQKVEVLPPPPTQVIIPSVETEASTPPPVPSVRVQETPKYGIPALW